MKSDVKRRLIIISVLLVIVVVSLFLLSCRNVNKEKQLMILDFENRVNTFKDFEETSINKYGWLQVQGTNVDVPILTITQPIDDYSYGWISSNSVGMKTRKVLIGHNVLNVSSTPMVNNPILTDFEDLMSFVYYDFAKENMYISFTEGTTAKTFIIYGIGFYNYNYDHAEGLNESSEIKDYIKMVKENSIYHYDVDINENDNLLTVKTCTRYFGNSEKQQFVIDARELREDEIPLKYDVKKTKLYKEYKLVDSYIKSNDL